MTDTFEKITQAGNLLDEFIPSEDKIPAYSTRVLDKLFAVAQPGVVFSDPVVSGN